MRRAFDKIVDFVARTRYENLPAPVVDQAKLVLMDTLAAILAGSQAPEIQNLARLASQASAAKPSTIFGYPATAAPQWASLVNATAGTSTELDEGNAYAKGHPAIHTIPAALALGEEMDSTGRDVLLSIVLGYEVATRVGTACELRNGAHPHGTWGTLGAAVAAAKLMGMDAEGIRETINLASSLTLATSFQTATDGALVRNIYAGMSNQNGLLATQLVQCGFTGEKDGVANVFGKVMSDTFRENALTDGLGRNSKSHAAISKNIPVVATITRRSMRWNCFARKTLWMYRLLGRCKSKVIATPQCCAIRTRRPRSPRDSQFHTLL